jgi:hypothetical protein
MAEMWWIGVAALVGLGACGRVGGVDAGDAGVVPLSELPARSLDVSCQYAVRCGRYANRATCAAVTSNDYGQLVASVKAGRAIYDGRAASDCFAFVTASDCSNVNENPPSCRDALKGQLPEGGTCFSDLDCMSGVCPINACPFAGCCQGACTAPVQPIPLGEVCGPGGSECAEDGVCAVRQNLATCAVRLIEGGACLSAGECAAGLICHRSAAEVVGFCAKPPGPGEPCDVVGFPCGSTTHFCDGSTGTCILRGTVGAACQSNEGCQDYARCDPSTMTCVARGAIGAACPTLAMPGASDGASDDLTCLLGLHCFEGKCVRPATRPVCP